MPPRPGRTRPRVLIAAACLLAAACGGPAEETSALRRRVETLEGELAAGEAALRHRRLTFDSLAPRGPAPTRDAASLASDANRITPEVLAEARATCSDGSGDCDPFAVMTVLAQAGKKCPDLRAQIGGLAQSCVTECDDGARYREAVACAQVACHEFCTDEGCTGGIYSEPDDCSDVDCFADPEICEPGCPLINACFFRTDEFNCRCFSL